jgi:hypothetical protein
MGAIPKMSDPTKNPFDLLLEQIRAVVAEEISKALNERKPAKLRFTLKEAAAALNCKPSWLASKVRKSEKAGDGFPHQRSGRLIYFTQRDIDEIVSQSDVKNGKD